MRSSAAGRIAAAVTGLTLIVGGGVVLWVAAAAQQHAPQPSPAEAGSIAPVTQTYGSAGTTSAAPACPFPHCAAEAARPGVRQLPGLVLAKSLPVLISIPAIGVRSKLLYVGLNPDGTIQVPPVNDPPVTNQAAWYEYSATPGQAGTAIIEGHVDTASAGPSVFFRLGALKPGDLADVALADHQVAVFTITAVRMYAKSRFPASVVYGNTEYPALRLITCGGRFNQQGHHYTSNIVAFAALVSAHPA